MPPMDASVESSPPVFLCASPLRARACALAAERHAGGLRWDGAPFVLHPFEVASILANTGGSDEVVAAGMLHDVLEKTDTVAGELRDQVGDEVAALVVAVSEDPAIADYAARKRVLRECAAAAGKDALAVLAADKVTKVRELRSQLLSGGGEDRDARLRLEHYEDTLATVRVHAPELPLTRQLEFELWALAAMPPRR
jgi:(p)ppGpp synthase/HD superfamily hydrolase